MTRVIVAPSAKADLDDLVTTLRLPRSTRARVKARLRLLARFPEQGAPLGGRWEGFRFLLGPWPWMLIVYVHDGDADHVYVVTIQDARSADAATTGR